MTLRCLQKALEALAITQVPALGQPFDPAIHEAMEHIQDDTLPENTVAKVVQQGFMQKDKLLRPALVVVATESRKIPRLQMLPEAGGSVFPISADSAHRCAEAPLTADARPP